jgi:SpoVK/Ycf46/Vps4 family AAA+-type ATPase
MEDFDNYFNGRECILKNDSIKFSFDSLINSLDGVHNDYKQVIFILTANDINSIDESLKNRPSRFRFVKEVPPPDRETRLRILKSETLVDLTEGYSLDKVFSYVGKAKPDKITE